MTRDACQGSCEEHSEDFDDPSSWIPLAPSNGGMHHQPGGETVLDESASVWSTKLRSVVSSAAASTAGSSIPPNEALNDQTPTHSVRHTSASPVITQVKSRRDGEEHELRSCDEHNDNFDDELSSWIPLSPPAVGIDESIGGATSRDENSHDWNMDIRSVAATPASESSLRRSEAPNNGSPTQQMVSASATKTQSQSRGDGEDLESIRRRLESRALIRESLIEHPLNHMWGRLLKHLAVELWDQDAHVRVGLTLIGTGSVLQLISLCTWINLYHPRSLFLLVVFILSCLYLFRLDETVDSVVRILTSRSAMVDALLSTLESLEPCLLRRVCLCLAMIPTLLEMRALVFLSGTVVECGLAVNVVVTLCIAAYMSYLKKVHNRSARDCSISGLVCLYVAALVAAVVHVRDIRRINDLCAPFLLAAGAFVLSYHSNQDGDEFGWLSRAVRHALRLTLRDVLADVGDRVAEDEMLQLSMLRWLVDYWSFTSTTNNEDAAFVGSTASTDNSIDVGTSTDQTESAIPRGSDCAMTWNELWSMLNMTTDQMSAEVQQHAVPSRVSPAADTTRQQSSEHSSMGNGSIQNLKSMLASLDVDERAKPAVLSYKRSVLNFPPSRGVAAVISVIRRCPSMLSLSFLYLSGSWSAFPTTMTLLPLMAFELIRVREWAKSISGNAGDSISDAVSGEEYSLLSINIPMDMDPMCILLSSDNFDPYHPSSSLQVWFNVQNSVQALESGLTVVRCVQTTAVATEFAGNVMSLAHLGVEVYQKGWVHGLRVVARELFHFHRKTKNPAIVRSDVQYTVAAISAVRNGQTVARNVGVLFEEEGANQIAGPVLHVLSAIVGRGWLWGKDESEHEDTSHDSEFEKYENFNGNRQPDLSYEGPAQFEVVERKESAISVEKESLSESRRLLESGKGSITEESSCAITQPSDFSKHEDRKHHNETSFTVRRSSCGDCDAESALNEELSSLFELVAEASERGLIDEAEKNSFVEVLLNSVGDQKASDFPSREEQKSVDVINVVRRSLECLFAESDLLAQAVEEATSEDGVATVKACLGSDAGEEGEVSDTSTCGVCLGAEAENVLGGRSISLQELDNLNLSENRCFGEDLVLSSNNRMELPDPSDSEDTSRSANESRRNGIMSSPIELSDEGKDGACGEDIRIDSHSGDHVSTAETTCDPDSVVSTDSVTSDRTVSPSVDCEDKVGIETRDQPTESEESSGDDWFKLLGGGLAVVGAVVGGVALMHTSNGGKQSRLQKSSVSLSERQRKSTVFIEEISDEDDK